MIDNAFNTQSVSLKATIELANISAELANVTAVPEPTTTGLLAFVTAGSLGQRRKIHSDLEMT